MKLSLLSSGLMSGFPHRKRSSRRRTSSPQASETLEARRLLTVPAYSSLPGANHTIYLDFNGHTTENTSWNSYYNQTSLVAPAYDTDGNASLFSAGELAAIQEAWKRTAEDFMPFNVNVTTVDPGIEALRKVGTGDLQWGIRVVITNESRMVTNSAERTGYGGIAYIDSFNWSTDTPVFVYTTGGKYVAEAISHEVGHSLGLGHDGLAGGAEYYNGHGSGDTGWAPIMGASYYKNVTQWDRGEYYNTSNGSSTANYSKGPDDLSIITTRNGFTYRADDHGNSSAQATALTVAGTTVSGGGLISTAADVDVFSFVTGAGSVTLNVSPFTPGPNLDIKADLYNSSGTLVASSNSSTVLTAGFSLNLAAGQYFLHVDGTGWGNPSSATPSGYSDYASLGQYFISGTIVTPEVNTPLVSIGDVLVSEGAGTVTFPVTLSQAASTSTSVTWSTVNGTALAGSDFVGTSGTLTIAAGVTTGSVTVSLLNDTVYEPTETFTVVLSGATGLLIADGVGLATITDDDLQPVPSVTINDVSVVEKNVVRKGRKVSSELTPATFTITLSAASSQSISVSYSTKDATAKVNGKDYKSASGTVTFSPGQTSATISVTVQGDNTVEGNEYFTVNLSNPSNAAIAKGTGIGTILDDDATSGVTAPDDHSSTLPTVSVSDVRVMEGNSVGSSRRLGPPPNFAVFTITLSAPSTTPVSVSYATKNGSASTGNKDYKSASGTVSFSPGETSKTVSVAINADRAAEGNEYFSLNLSNPTNAAIMRGTGIATILDDDTVIVPQSERNPVLHADPMSWFIPDGESPHNHDHHDHELVGDHDTDHAGLDDDQAEPAVSLTAGLSRRALRRAAARQRLSDSPAGEEQLTSALSERATSRSAALKRSALRKAAHRDGASSTVDSAQPHSHHQLDNSRLAGIDSVFADSDLLSLL